MAPFSSPSRFLQAALNLQFTRLPQADSGLEAPDVRESTGPKRLNSRLLVRVLVRVALGALLLGTILQFTLVLPLHRIEEPRPVSTAQPSTGLVLDPSFYVNGPPTSKFRGNLNPSFKYITAFNYAGFTNDYMIWCNAIYLAVLSRRIPILGPLLPMSSHLGKGGNAINFGEIFDLPRLAEIIQTPILQWSDVKKALYNTPFDYDTEDTESGAETDYIGCWSVWPTINKNEREPVGSSMPWFLHLNIVWTQAPSWIKLPHREGYTASFSALAKLLLPEGRTQALSAPEAKTRVTYDDIPKEIEPQLDPDDQLACFDILYFVGTHYQFEWEKPNHPVWELVGTNLHFTQKVEDIASEYLRRLFGISGHNETEIPPYISVHVRHSDFLNQCHNVKLEDCLAPLSAFTRRVKQVQDELAYLHGSDSPLANVQNVVVTSDERDPEWWAEVHKLGWLGTNEFDEELGKKYGRWYPTIIDAAIQARGKAFVGTQGSTMSDYAARRVQDWQRGPWKLVRWGSKDADISYSGDFAKRNYTL